MYTEGTIEKDIAVTTSTQAQEKFLQGSYAALLTDGGSDMLVGSVGEPWSEVHGHDFFDDVKFLGVMKNKEGKLAYSINDYAWSESYINSKVDDEKFNRILSIYDYLVSQEGYILSNCGIEGKSYGYDKDGKITYEGYNNGGYPWDTFKSLGLFRTLAVWTDGMEWAQDIPGRSPQGYLDVDFGRIKTAEKLEVPKYNYDCTSAYLASGQDFSLNVQDDLLNIMTGTEDVDKMWNDIIAKYKADGLEDVIKQVNEAVKK